MTTFVRRTLAIVVGLALPLAVALPAGASSDSTQSVKLQWEQTQQRLQQTERHLQQVKRSLSSDDSETPRRHVEVIDPTVYAELDTAVDNAQAAGFDVGNLPARGTAEDLLREQGVGSTVDLLIDVVQPLTDPQQKVPELPSLGLLDTLLQLVFDLLASLGLPLPLPLPLPVSDLPAPTALPEPTALSIPLQESTS